VGCGKFEIAQAFAKLGQPDSAIAYYNFTLDTAGTFRVFGDAINLAATYQRLGELYETKGDRKRAVECYEKLIALWKNADPELQPIVKDAKERVARLSGEH
jgi:tetratricopeptide (TPR) repeat protein